MSRPIHPDFLRLLSLKDQPLVDLFTDLREFVLEICPESNELLYHTHALTSVFSVSEKLGDSFCMLPIYTNHVNLGFNKGTLIHDPRNLLSGTGNLIRHIPISQPKDYRNPQVEDLIRAAVDFAANDMDKPSGAAGKTISKIKRP